MTAMLRYILRFAGFFLASTFQLYSAGIVELPRISTNTDSGADKLWLQVKQVLIERKKGLRGLEYYFVEEENRLRYRALGREFFEKYPSDPRRWDWLIKTVSKIPPWYFVSDDVRSISALNIREPWHAVLDEAAQNAWDEYYHTVIKPELFSPELGVELKRQLCMMELDRLLVQECIYRKSRGEEPAYDTLIETALSYIRLFPEDTEFQPTQLQYIHLAADNYGIGDAAARSYITKLRASLNSTLTQIADGWEQTLELKSTPLTLRLSTITGTIVDLETRRGKPTLVFIWSNWCSSCKDAMPRIKLVYEKYRQMGFEVVGVWWSSNPVNEREKALEILNRYGCTWENGILTGSMLKEFTEKYHIKGVPVFWLLDNEGLLVTTDVHSEKLEKEVRRLLGLRPQDEKRAKARTSAVEPHEHEGKYSELLAATPASKRPAGGLIDAAYW